MNGVLIEEGVFNFEFKPVAQKRSTAAGIDHQADLHRRLLKTSNSLKIRVEEGTSDSPT